MKQTFHIETGFRTMLHSRVAFLHRRIGRESPKSSFQTIRVAPVGCRRMELRRREQQRPSTISRAQLPAIQWVGSDIHQV
jgi:hypothetical protein